MWTILYWRTERNGKDIYRHYREPIAGGANSDNDKYDKFKPVELGVYYKFNEGITGVSNIDSTVLDYSGRISNGKWTGYAFGFRFTGSLIESSGINEKKEFKDPIIYSFHPHVTSSLKTLKEEGRNHDHNNASMIYNHFPGWMLSEDREGTLYDLTQIISLNNKRQ